MNLNHQSNSAASGVSKIPQTRLFAYRRDWRNDQPVKD